MANIIQLELNDNMKSIYYANTEDVIHILKVNSKLVENVKDYAFELQCETINNIIKPIKPALCRWEIKSNVLTELITDKNLYVEFLEGLHVIQFNYNLFTREDMFLIDDIEELLDELYMTNYNTPKYCKLSNKVDCLIYDIRQILIKHINDLIFIDESRMVEYFADYIKNHAFMNVFYYDIKTYEVFELKMISYR